MTIGESGYPCRAFLHDGAVRPAQDDPDWTDAPNGNFIGWSESSTVPATGYMQIQFRYFRSRVFVPADVQPTSFTVVASTVDDSLHVVLFNSLHPGGISPTDVGPSVPGVGACVGNGSAIWNLAAYLAPGEVNTVLVVHADMQPPYSTLGSVDIQVNGTSVSTVTCPVDGG